MKQPYNEMSEMEMPEAAAPAQSYAEGDTADKGYRCEATFPLTGPMWTQDVHQGQP